MTDAASTDLLDHMPPLSGAAIFLDFDGTLVALAERPDAINVPPILPEILYRLHGATSGATALVSGRSVDDLLRYVPDFPGTVVGGHGAERREGGQRRQHDVATSGAVDAVVQAFNAFCEQHPGTLCEVKPAGAVLHYRLAPGAEAAARAVAERQADEHPEFELHEAKMAFELRPRDVGKDHAVADLMDKAPFCNRHGIFFGDDATDEPAMRFLLGNKGSAVKIGEGPSCAHLRLVYPSDTLTLLTRWLESEI